ncbi:MAG: tRNA pseudouridine(13) synthase TruD [Gammaproteobacteria bacterium]|nr:tRNA pseudouridine(13) synthase TruD [Gammaproteobacteria bacterium]
MDRLDTAAVPRYPRLAPPMAGGRSTLEPALARLGDVPAVTGRIRACPEDFQVEEDLGFAPDGNGEHFLIQIRKRDCNTPWVARELARIAEVPARDVSYAGLKDRHAVAVQWFSIRVPGTREPDWAQLEGDALQVLSVSRHRRKLRRGALHGNRFRILLREPQGPWDDLERRVARVARSGVPNYFGPQRFGLQYGNVTAAQAWFRGDTRAPDRLRRGLYLSAARAHLFNTVLTRRVQAGDWDRLLPGEVAMLEGTHSVFAVPQPDAVLERRAAQGDVHPTGPLWGAGGSRVTGHCAEVEAAALAGETTLRAGLEAAGLRAERRTLRVMVPALRLARVADGAEFEFRLPAGAYATTVLRELVHLETEA